MECVAQVRVDATSRRAARGQLAENERAKKRDDAATRPRDQNQSRYGYSLRDNRRRAENSRADDAADHDQNDVGDAETRARASASHGAFAENRDAPHAAAIREIVGQRAVLRPAVIPERYRAFPPAPANLKLGARHMSKSRRSSASLSLPERPSICEVKS